MNCVHSAGDRGFVWFKLAKSPLGITFEKDKQIPLRNENNE